MRLPTAWAVALALLPAVALAEDITGTASVIDGDTIDIHGTRIRLHGIDAPESRQTCLAVGERGGAGNRRRSPWPIESGAGR